ncbi:GNAT family N-acetyltransferase [Kineococcus sp. SYSU DK018]|uniref:GNAT family N-acetyltransferase n=1 Tax=Kineococcus sp. SYSU DK018 TaxID=3383139 RepID=UPI003D7D6CCF
MHAHEQFRVGALSDERCSSNRIAVAEFGAAVVGIAVSGPVHDTGTPWSRQSHVLHVDAAHHRSGAGTALLNAALDLHEAAALWVADPDPRAQAFCRKHGFAPDGHSRTRTDVLDVRVTGGDVPSPAGLAAPAQDCSAPPTRRADGGSRRPWRQSADGH